MQCVRRKREEYEGFFSVYSFVFFLSSAQTGQAFSFKLKPPFKNPGSVIAQKGVGPRGLKPLSLPRKGWEVGAKPPQIDTVPNDISSN